jgi:hypothetical protein
VWIQPESQAGTAARIRSAAAESNRYDIKVPLLMIVELESLLQDRNEKLKKLPSNSPRRLSIEQNFANLRLPPIQSTSAPYVDDSICNNPNSKSSPPSEKFHIQRPASALDNLAEAAASSPPAVDRSSRSPEIDPKLRNPSVSFPSFPHDIFNTSPQKITIPMQDVLTTPLERPSSWTGPEMDGLPNVEIMPAMYFLSS